MVFIPYKDIYLINVSTNETIIIKNINQLIKSTKTNGVIIDRIVM